MKRMGREMEKGNNTVRRSWVQIPAAPHPSPQNLSMHGMV